MASPRISDRTIGNSLFHNPYVFADFYNAVADDVVGALRQVPPLANRDSTDLRGFPRPEMQAEVTLREVSAATASLLRSADGRQRAE